MSDAVAVVRDWFGNAMPRAMLAADAPWVVSPGYPVPKQAWRGRDEVFDAFFPALRAQFNLWRPEVAALFAAEGGRVVATGQYAATWKGGSGVGHVPFLHVWTVRDGLVAGVEAVADFAALPGRG